MRSILRAVLQMLASGKTSKEIAGSLHISVRTVETYVSSLLMKFGARNRAQLATLGRSAEDS